MVACWVFLTVAQMVTQMATLLAETTVIRKDQELVDMLAGPKDEIGVA